MKFSLCGKWQFAFCGDKKTYDATVPGCNYLDLMANGVIEDPFYGTNEKDCYFVAEKDCVYSRTFFADEQLLSCDEVNLVAKTLDTSCEIYINGEFVKKCENCFIAYTIDVKKFLKLEENEIKIIFFSPVNTVKEKCKGKAVPPNANGQNGVAYLRKPSYHFGWDWGPVLPPSGITDEIYIEGRNKAKITALEIAQKHNENGSVSLSVSCKSKKLSECDCKTVLTLICPCGEEKKIEAERNVFEIENPELWWTYELSKKDKQPLYKVKAEIFVNGETVDSKEKTIGLRTIELDRSEDEYGHTFCFILNGVSIFAKGADYIPGDNFMPRQTKEDFKKLADAMRYSNFNMLRVWGGGYYASDELLSLCDEMGILIWQDFQFACMPYPFFDKDFLAGVKQEVEYNVERIKSHPCLALWCGNNEIETMQNGWLYLREYISATKEFFFGTLKQWVSELDGVTAFIPGSPCGVDYGKETDSDLSGDTHIWSVWHGLADMNIYRKRFTRFCSEFGFESLPDIKTIEKFCEKKDYALDSETFLSHQKCFTGNEKIIYYVNSYFGMPKKFEDFIYLSQITQAICIQNATEHWRRNKGRCNGALYWQFNDCWPTCSWSSYDYYGNYKALQYFAKRFNEALTVSFEDTEENLKVMLLNDLNERQELKAKLEIFDFANGISKKQEKNINIAENSNLAIFELSLKELLKQYDKKTTGVCVRLFKGEEEFCQRVYLLDKERKLALPKAKLKVEKRVVGNEIEITLSSDKFAHFVNVSSTVSSLAFSENYFDILPGESKTVMVKIDESADIEKQLSAIEVVSFSDIEMRSMTGKEKIAQLKMLLSPVTIGNMLWHRRLSK